MSKGGDDGRVGLHMDFDCTEVAVNATVGSFNVHHALNHAEELLHSGQNRLDARKLIFTAVCPGSHGFAGFLLKEEKFSDLIDSLSGTSFGVLVAHDVKVTLRSSDAIASKAGESALDLRASMTPKD